jgi:hypothetical protein
MLDDWDAFVLGDEIYEVQTIILMDDFVQPLTFDVFWLLRIA